MADTGTPKQQRDWLSGQYTPFSHTFRQLGHRKGQTHLITLPFRAAAPLLPPFYFPTTWAQKRPDSPHYTAFPSCCSTPAAISSWAQKRPDSPHYTAFPSCCSTPAAILLSDNLGTKKARLTSLHCLSELLLHSCRHFCPSRPPTRFWLSS